MSNLERIRKAERESHIEMYNNNELFTEGSWLARPVRTIMELFPFYENYSCINVLDLGSGVGRNAIPIAERFSDRECNVDCVDLLDIAIKKLLENSRRNGIEEHITGIVQTIDDFKIEKSAYDLIIAVSSLEHMGSKDSLERKLNEMKEGIRSNGIICFIMNSEVVEIEKETGEELAPQFEVNIKTKALMSMLDEVYGDWQCIKKTVVPQKYNIPRGDKIAELSTNVITYVVRKEKEVESE